MASDLKSDLVMTAFFPLSKSFSAATICVLSHNDQPMGLGASLHALCKVDEQHCVSGVSLRDLPWAKNMLHKLRDGVKHRPFNAMAPWIQNNFCNLILCSLVSILAHFDWLGLAKPLLYVQHQIVKSVMFLPSLDLVERDLCVRDIKYPTSSASSAKTAN